MRGGRSEGVESKTKFVLFSWARTGSYFLTDLLDQQPGVDCHGEAYRFEEIELNSQCLNRLKLKKSEVAKRDANPLDFLDKIYQCSTAPVVGFKLFPHHAPEVQKAIMEDPSVRVIFLVRNPIQSYISEMKARQTGNWTLQSDREEGAGEALQLDLDECLRLFLIRKKIYEKCRARAVLWTDFPLFVIDYSELNDSNILNKLASFLGLEGWSTSVEQHYFKQLRAPYPELIENWQEVERFCEIFGVDHQQSFGEFANAFNKSLAE